MAEGAVAFLLQQLEVLLRRELDLPEKINAGILSLKRELKSMRAFFQDADVKGEHDNRYRVWTQEVRDLAYEIEDVLDMFAFHHLGQLHNSFFSTHWLTKFTARHSIASLIEDINAKLQSIQQTKQRYSDMTYGLGASTSSLWGYTYFPPRIAPLFMDDDDIVGFEGPRDKLTSWLDGRAPRCEVMFVVGMGGSGKTTLARKVYERVKDDFDCHAWITLSRSQGRLDILSTMFNRLSNPEAESTPQRFSHINEVDLMDKIRNYLQGKRYLIVLDDLRAKEIWESIQHALAKNTCGRIIITTTRSDIAYSYGHNHVYIHHVQPLSQERAQELFYRKAFPQTRRCPSGLVEWSKCILQKCDGLPLAIIEVGQNLSSREKTESEWKKLYDSIGLELRINGRLSNTMRVLFMSYKNLPHHLKYCLQYLSIFPENCPVECRKLVRLWVAEGFIAADEHTSKEIEEIGEDYLKELIQRSLVQPSETDFDGRPKTCRLHCLMHKIILTRSRDENFCTICTENSGERSRRLSVQDLSLSINKFNYARTLIVFGRTLMSSHPLTSFSIPANMPLLKVLELDSVNLETFPSAIEQLFLLRYLSLRNTKIKIIPKSIGNLQHLETLDLKHTLVSSIPGEALIKLAKLRHLLVYRYEMYDGYVAFDAVKGFEAPSKIKKLARLQKLAFVKANERHNHELIQGLGSLKQLRKLGIVDLPREEGHNLCLSIQMLTNLNSLNVASLHKDEFLDLEAINRPPPLLRRLYLKGRLERWPTWVSKLHDLARLRLKWSKLRYNPIGILQDLPNLLELQLLDAYSGDLLDFTAGKFQKLQILDLEQLEQLRMVIMEKTALPCLQTLIIKKCNNLFQAPVGIDSLTHLEKLIIYDMPPGFVARLQKNGEFHSLVRHIPNICFLST